VATPLAKLREIVRGVLRDADLDLAPTSRFEDIPGWDSMHLIAVVVEIECWFDLVFDPAEIETLHDVGDLLRLTACKQMAASV